MQTNRIVTVIILFLLQCLACSISPAQSNQEITLQSKFTGRGYALCGSCTLPRELSSVLWLTSKDEPGQPIILTGTIYGTDGVTPDSGVMLFVYQTDAGGYYHRPEENVFHPRIFGWVATGKDGRYEIHTVKPAPEVLVPNEPAHIHVHIFGKGMKEHFLHEFWFQGDSRISAEEKKSFAKLGDFSPIITLTEDKDGVMKGIRNIRIRPAPQWKYEIN